jgi:hypothetical protein
LSGPFEVGRRAQVTDDIVQILQNIFVQQAAGLISMHPEESANHQIDCQARKKDDDQQFGKN